MLSASSCCRCVSLAVAASFAMIAGASLCSASSAVVTPCMGSILAERNGCVRWRSARRRRAAVQTALFLLLVLPPPAAGALRLARLDRARAWRAADRQEAAIVQRIVGNAVFAHEIDHAAACPVQQRIHLDQVMQRIDRGL